MLKLKAALLIMTPQVAPPAASLRQRAVVEIMV